MTITQNSTTPATVKPIFVVPSVVAAQRAGDADYDWVLERTHDGQAAAEAYHLAYQRIARMPGGPGPVCDCDLCRAEFNQRAEIH